MLQSLIRALAYSDIMRMWRGDSSTMLQSLIRALAYSDIMRMWRGDSSTMLQSLIRALAYSDGEQSGERQSGDLSCNPSFGLWPILTTCRDRIGWHHAQLQSLIRALAYSDGGSRRMPAAIISCCNPSFGLWPILTSWLYCSMRSRGKQVFARASSGP